MHILLRTVCSGLAIAASAAMAVPLQAQEQYSSAIKLRAGTVSGAVTKESLGRRTHGLGLELARTFGKGQIFAEATFDLFNGYRREVTQFGPAWYAGDASQDPFHPSAPSQTYGGHALITEPSHSLAAEMLEYQGFGLRLGYRAPLTLSWAQGWDWQAGISVDRRETRHEVMTTYTPGWQTTDAKGVTSFNTIPALAARLDTDYYEGARFTNTTYKMEFGAFAGISHTFNDIFRTEVNARYTTFQTPRYNTFTSTGKVPTISDSTKGGLVLEVAIAVKL